MYPFFLVWVLKPMNVPFTWIQYVLTRCPFHVGPRCRHKMSSQNVLSNCSPGLRGYLGPPAIQTRLHICPFVHVVLYKQFSHLRLRLTLHCTLILILTITLHCTVILTLTLTLHCTLKLTLTLHTPCTTYCLGWTQYPRPWALTKGVCSRPHLQKSDYLTWTLLFVGMRHILSTGKSMNNVPLNLHQVILVLKNPIYRKHFANTKSPCQYQWWAQKFHYSNI